MLELLTILLKVAGCGLIALALLHVPISQKLRWREEARQMSETNGSIFLVHAFFICVVLLLMGLPCVFESSLFLEPTRAGRWLCWSLAGFWALRLYCQWFVYPASLWRGKRMETAMHGLFSVIWFMLTGLFTACGLVQSGVLH